MSWDPVYKLVKQIPRGRVLTYGAVARALRLPGGARTAVAPWRVALPERGFPGIAFWARAGSFSSVNPTLLCSESSLNLRAFNDGAPRPHEASRMVHSPPQVPQKTSRAKKTIKINSSVPLKLRPKFRPAPFQSAAQQNVRMIPRLLILDAKPIRVFCRHTATRKFSLR